MDGLDEISIGGAESGCDIGQIFGLVSHRPLL